MIRALFVTTTTNDCANHVAAWESAFGPVAWLRYDYTLLRHDESLVEGARSLAPEVIFYIGAYRAPGNPSVSMLKALNAIAPSINLCSDAADRPWHSVLRHYAENACFTAQVSIDGARHAPVDITTLTPVDTRRFAGDGIVRNIRCGFSGSLGNGHPRADVVRALQASGNVTVRARDDGAGYASHVAFLKRCRMTLNTSHTGSAAARHIKGRVLEAGWAGGCLLEDEGSPIGNWFPAGSWIPYRDATHAAELISTLDDETIARTAARLAATVRERYTPANIYGEILKRVGVA